MPRYHYNPATDEVGACRARKRCPFGALERHFPNKQEAQEYQEDLHRYSDWLGHKSGESHPLTLQALELKFSAEDTPYWWEHELQEYQKTWPGESPEYLGTLHLDGTKVAAYWEAKSSSRIDIDIIRERGMQCARLLLKDWESGEDIGYLKAGWVDEDSVRRSWGSDGHESLRYYIEFSGRGYGIGRSYDSETREHTHFLEEALAHPEDEDLQRQLWASAHRHMEVVPDSVDRSQLTWGSAVNLKVEHAPEDPEQVARDLAELKKVWEAELQHFKEAHAVPSIDYSEIEKPYRGQGLGPALYVLAGRRLARDGFPLEASGLQSPEAQRVWERMARDRNLPMEVTSASWYVGHNGWDQWRTRAKLQLDFR